MMTREEAIAELEKMSKLGSYTRREALKVALSALRPVSREQVEKVWRGEWGVDEFGHKCSKCGEYLPSGDDDIFPQFCPNCGDAKTDEAVEILLRRLEAMYDDTGD